MRKKAIFFALLFTTCTSGFCQVTGANGYLPNFDPPSPEASALGKYVDHPVGNFTGTPKINIPLFEIKEGRISLPISISYHGSGVLVDEIASRVGIGWALNAGGVVTRTAKGFADDVNVLGWGTTSAIGYFDSSGPSYHSNNKAISIDPPNDYSTQYDLEPDPHFYNFGNKSGKIFFTGRTTPYAVNMDPIKIDGPYNGNNRFIITTEDGIVYTFSAAEVTHNLNYTGVSYRYTSAWYLTQIHDPVTGKDINLTYRTDMSAALNYSYQKSYSLDVSCDGGAGTIGLGNESQIQIENSQVLDKISYDDGYIEFKADHNRQDLTGDRAYTEVNQYVYVNSVATLVKGYNLNYAYTSNGPAQENFRLYLESLQEKGSDNTSTLPRYLFSYKNRSLVPERDSPQQDIWGYYNANGATAIGFAKVYVHNNGAQSDYLPFDNPANPATTVVSGVERSSNATTIDYGTLNRITYPTGGYTIYTYEAHQFDTYVGGGVRIKQIDDYLSSGQLVLSKKYQYDLGFLGGAYPQVAYPTNFPGLVRFSYNRSVLGSSQGSYVGYGQVVETQINSTGSTNGSINYVYTTDRDVPGNFSATINACPYLNNLSTIRARSYFPFFEMQSLEERRGLLTHQVYYDASNHPLKVISYNYNLISGLIAPIYSSHIEFDLNNTTITDLNEVRSLNAEKMYLSSKTEDEYIGATSLGQGVSPSLSNTTVYNYIPGPHNSQFLQSETHYNNGTGIIPDPDSQWAPSTFAHTIANQVIYTYPFNYSNPVMTAMVSMNYINPVITEVKTTTKNFDTTPVTYYTDARVTNYMQNANSAYPPFAIVPSQVFQLNLSVPIQQFPSSGSNIGVEIADPYNPGSLYEKRLEYLNYDANSNPLAINHDGQTTVFSWSSNSQLLSKLNSLNPYSVSGPNVGLLTTYTYDAMMRLQSVTDPTGKFQTYEYDLFGRLINIKDSNGNIIKHTDYHYANQ